jgi:hypothetical protein
VNQEDVGEILDTLSRRGEALLIYRGTGDHVYARLMGAGRGVSWTGAGDDVVDALKDLLSFLPQRDPDLCPVASHGTV